MLLSENEQKKLLDRSAALRGSGLFQEAVNLINQNISEFTGEHILSAHLEAFYAAQEGRIDNQAKSHASSISAIDPNIPSVQKFLSRL